PEANSFGSAVSGGAAMTFLGSPRPAASDSYIASQPLPTFNSAGAIGVVPGYTSIGNQWMVSAVVVMPEGGVTDEAVLLDIRTDGTAARWLVRYDTSGAAGQLRLQVLDVDGADLLNTTQDFDIDDKPFLLYVEGGNNGSNALWTLGCAPVLDMSTVPSVSAPSGIITSASAPRVTRVGVGTGVNLNNDIAIGHVAVYGA
ncbi:hypothetical protein, partial [Sporichthya brevicatena]|uniref:hypothetical protein n=1 Tax=Sporichthya brevicatena TaxID=171442 RepID=UPI0031E1604B